MGINKPIKEKQKLSTVKLTVISFVQNAPMAVKIRVVIKIVKFDNFKCYTKAKNKNANPANCKISPLNNIKSLLWAMMLLNIG